MQSLLKCIIGSKITPERWNQIESTYTKFPKELKNRFELWKCAFRVCTRMLVQIYPNQLQEENWQRTLIKALFEFGSPKQLRDWLFGPQFTSVWDLLKRSSKTEWNTLTYSYFTYSCFILSCITFSSTFIIICKPVE